MFAFKPFQDGYAGEFVVSEGDFVHEDQFASQIENTMAPPMNPVLITTASKMVSGVGC